MRPLPTFHLRYPDVTAARTALAAGAVAGLLVIAACTDAGTKSITAPPAPRAATTSSGGYGQAKLLKLCVDPSSPTGVYTFVNTKLNRSVSVDGLSQALPGNGFFYNGNWYDPGDGGDGTTIANAAQGVNYTITNHGTVGTPDCVTVLDRTVGNSTFMAKLPISEGGTCDPNTTSCGGINDSFAAATVTYVSNTVGATYDHTDCNLDNGVLIPQQANPPNTFPTWPNSGLSWDQNNPSGYICDNHNNPTRGFVNYEHGATLTFVFDAPVVITSTGIIAPTATTCEDYAAGTAPTLADILVGYKQGAINNASPGVFFYYATLTKPASTEAGFRTASISPNPGSLVKYTVMQTQAYLYTYNASTKKCTTAATLTLGSDLASGSGGSGLPAGSYILGVKYATDAQKGIAESSLLQVSNTLLATHNYVATVGGADQPSTTASVNTRSK